MIAPLDDIDEPSAPPAGSGGATAVLLTQHHWLTPRRAGFHNLATALCGLGWDVVFATVGFSPISLARRDDRARAFRLRQANRILPTAEGVRMYVWLTPFHPVNLRGRLANRAVAPLYPAYGRLPMPGLGRALERAALVMVESSSALLLVERLRRRLPRARLVYRQSDIPSAVAAHPIVGEYERRVAPLFDLISVPDEGRARPFAPGLPVAVHPHGVDAEGFAAATASPYPAGDRPQAVFTGVEGLDREFVRIAAEEHPGCDIHLIGPWRREGLPPNVHSHGTLPFRRTLPFIRFADIGLQCVDVPSPSARTRTPKVMQYTYCGLPIVARAGADADMPHVFAYEPGSRASIRDAMGRALAFPRERVPASEVRSWTEVAGDIVQAAGLTRARTREMAR